MARGLCPVPVRSIVPRGGIIQPTDQRTNKTPHARWASGARRSGSVVRGQGSGGVRGLGRPVTVDAAGTRLPPGLLVRPPDMNGGHGQQVDTKWTASWSTSCPRSFSDAGLLVRPPGRDLGKKQGTMALGRESNVRFPRNRQESNPRFPRNRFDSRESPGVGVFLGHSLRGTVTREIRGAEIPGGSLWSLATVGIPMGRPAGCSLGRGLPRVRGFRSSLGLVQHSKHHGPALRSAAHSSLPLSAPLSLVFTERPPYATRHEYS